MFEIGNSLREARLRQGLELPEIEQSTKIRARYLRALEEEQFDALPAQTYVKGFLRTYAEYLGLDGQLYVDEYNSRYVTGEDELPLRRSSVVPPRQGRRLESRVVLLALLAIALVTALVIAAWKSGGSNQSVPNLKQSTGQTKAAQKKKHSRPALARLVVSAPLGNSWLEVHRGSATGRQLFAGTLDQGEHQRFAARVLWVHVGAPWNLVVRLNGKTVPLSGARRTMLVSAKGITAAPSGA